MSDYNIHPVDSMNQQTRLHERATLARTLALAGIKDVLVIDRGSAVKVLTERRQELLQEIRDGDVDSVRGLARALDRDVAAVSRDVDLLLENDVLEYETEGKRRIPRLKHTAVIPEPIISKGEAFDDVPTDI